MEKDVHPLQKNNEEKCYQELYKQWRGEGNRLVSVEALLQKTSKAYPNAPALITAQETITYAQLMKMVLCYASFLEAQGIGEGDRVILFQENDVLWYVSYYALWHCGAIPVPLNPALTTHELMLIMKDAHPQMIITSSKYYDFIEEVLCSPEIDPEEQIIHEVITRSRVTPRVSKPLSILLKQMPGKRRALHEPALLLYTSGTTGIPKGVVLTSLAILTNCMQSLARFKMTVPPTHKDRFMGVLPLFHVFSQQVNMWLPCMVGASVILVNKIERAAVRWGFFQKPTFLFAVPALFGFLLTLRLSDTVIDSIRAFVSGADALPDKIRMGFELLYGRKIINGYGMTEASPVIAVSVTDEYVDRRVVGHPLCGIECKVEVKEGQFTKEAGVVGTLWIKGNNIMREYYNAPSLTQSVLINGWLNTGDLASFQEDGQIVIEGRSKDIIINKGINIYPAEVENILMNHAAVMKAAVVGKSHSEQGEVVVAFVSLRPGMTVSPSQLALHCSKMLAPYKVPRSITILPDIALTATGKIDKKALRSLLL